MKINYIIICIALGLSLSFKSMAESNTPPASASDLKIINTELSNDFHVFKDIESLKAWAAASISALGINPALDKLQLNGAYSIDNVEFNQIKGIIVRRYKGGRGVANCMLSIFINNAGGEWVESLRLKDLDSSLIEYHQQGDWVTLTLRDSKKEILRFTLSGLYQAR